jgi:aspartoacylase
MNILIIGAQHGNEPLGEGLINYIKQHRPDLLPHCTYRTGNPRAKRAGVRYIESDLNRSFTGGNKTYEERRAARLLAYIRKNNFNLVIDAHTTTCAEPPCFIAHTLNGEAGRFMAASSIKKTVHMHPDIAKTSLIGVCSRAVSIEVNIDEVKEPLLHDLAQAIDNYIHGRAPYSQKTIYQIAGFILKSEISEQASGSLRNFQKSPYGYYPVLTGENSYKKLTNYLGFKAYKVYKTKV